MSLQIYLASSGRVLQADPISFASPDALKSWVEKHAHFPVDRQILITGRGKNVRPQNLLTETEVFVYDKQYISPSTGIHPPEAPSPSPLQVPTPPTFLTNATNLQAWHDLFRARRDWAIQLVESVASHRDVAHRALRESQNIYRASSLALDNLQSHVRNIQGKLEDTSNWAREAIEDHKNVLRDWDSNLQILGRIPAKSDFAFLLRQPQSRTEQTTQWVNASTDIGSLQGFVNRDDIERAASSVTVATREFKRQIGALDGTMEEISADTRKIETAIHASTDTLNSETLHDLYSNLETVAGKIASDYEELAHFPDDPKSVSTASRRALVHTRDLLPALQNSAAEISDFAAKAVLQRNTSLEASTRSLHNISSVQSELVDFQSQLANFGLASEYVDAYDLVRTVFDLPVAYGSILIESVRRNEWLESVRTNADFIKTELEAEKDEELRRRRKWIKSMGGMVVDSLQVTNIGADVSVSQFDEEWPSVNRQEVLEYIDALRDGQIDDAVQQVTNLFKQLESSKPRKRRFRAFKSGTVHDAELTYGRSSDPMNDEDEAVKTLRGEKSRLEDKLRGSDSRVRKLEDLLHRQSQMNRPTSTNLGHPASETDRRPQSPIGLPSPRPSELISRRSSVSSRRLSSNQNPEDKALIQRIVGLEADLRTERDTVSKLQRAAHADRRASTESRDRMNEAESTKRDLLANFEAQRQEFDDERQLLEDEMHKMKIRLEEVEDELDRVLGSRDHQGIVSNATIAHLQEDLDRLQRETSERLAAADRQAESDRNDLASEKKRAAELDNRSQQLSEVYQSVQADKLELAQQLREQADAQAENIASLQAAHSHLFPGGSAPNDLGRLATAVETLSEGMAIHTRNADDAVQLSVVEKTALETQIAEIQSQLEHAEHKFSSNESDGLMLRETLAQERNKHETVQHDLAAAHAELDGFRAQLTEGEMGSESLKGRISEEERKVASLSERLAVANSHVQSLEQEILTWEGKVSSLTMEAKQLKDRLDVRGVRAKDLSQRLLSNNDRMIRMLEQMGYSVVRQDDALVIQRSSKVNASTVLSADGLTSICSPPAQSPVQHYSNTADLDTLHWISESDPTAEHSKFQSFISTLSLIDIDAAADMVTQRYKDVKTLARKYQKDSRAYRERAHRLQGEAHDKIAYRSFREGDLALFLPTRNQATRPWAAFNVGAPHYFLREQDTHKLQTRDWLLARISKVEERVVDLSKSLANGPHGRSASITHDRRSINTEMSDPGSIKSLDDENPFELSDGLRWYLIDASEDKPGAPAVLTPGLGKSTVAATNVDARGSIRLTQEGKKIRDASGNGSAAIATKTLNKSLESRRSSSVSKKGHAASPSRDSLRAGQMAAAANESMLAKSTRSNSSSAQGIKTSEGAQSSDVLADEGTTAEATITREDAQSPTRRDDAAVFEVVRKDLLFGP